MIAPDFLFRMERDPAGVPPGTAYDVRRRRDGLAAVVLPLEQHSRRRAARSGRVAASSASRPCARHRSGACWRIHVPRALVDNFAGQWLYLRNLANVVPDPIAFPEFDENLRDAFRRETELFVDSQIREDRSVSELIAADYTFANERLARHYGIPNVYGSHFRRVRLDGSEAAVRGGILGHGSLLTVTSYPNRTSPVLRGKWMLANVLGTPPPPPPARCAGSAGQRRGRAPRNGAGAARGAPAQSDVPRVPCPDGSARPRARELRCDRHVAQRRGRAADRRVGDAARRDEVRGTRRSAWRL